MIALQCDLCKKPYIPYTTMIDKQPWNGFKLTRSLSGDNRDNNVFQSTNNYDLCKECMEELHKFIKGRTKENTEQD